MPDSEGKNKAVRREQVREWRTREKCEVMKIKKKGRVSKAERKAERQRRRGKKRDGHAGTKMEKNGHTCFAVLQSLLHENEAKGVNVNMQKKEKAKSENM